MSEEQRPPSQLLGELGIKFEYYKEISLNGNKCEPAVLAKFGKSMPHILE
jgi:hypothetical protein